MLEKIGKFKLLIVGVLVSFLFIAITIGQLQKRQEIRSRAAGQPVSVILEPQTSSKNVGGQFDVKVSINGADNNVSAVDITFTYSKDLLTLASNGITSFGTFTTILNEAGTEGSIHYVGVNPTANPISGSSINLGTLSFRARSQGTASLGFSNIHVNASGVRGALPVDTENTKEGIYTIGGVNELTPTPTGTTQEPTPTLLPQETRILLSLSLTGIGNSTESARGLNNSPRRETRTVEIKILNAQNQEIMSSRGSATYDSATGQYKGSVSLGSNFQSGPYAIKVRMDNTLWKSIPGVQNITQGTSYAAPKTELVSGDFNQDNEINLLDYNLMISCLANAQCRNNPQAKINLENLLYVLRNNYRNG